MSLVTVEEVNNALRLDLGSEVGGDLSGDGGEDTSRLDDIELKIAQAEAIVLGFVQPAPDPAWTHENVPKEVSAAIILVVGYLYDNTDAGREALAALSGENPNAYSPVKGLLWRRRTPSLA